MTRSVVWFAALIDRGLPAHISGVERSCIISALLSDAGRPENDEGRPKSAVRLRTDRRSAHGDVLQWRRERALGEDCIHLCEL